MPPGSPLKALLQTLCSSSTPAAGPEETKGGMQQRKDLLMVELQAPWLLYTDRLRGKQVSPGPLR